MKIYEDFNIWFLNSDEAKLSNRDTDCCNCVIHEHTKLAFNSRQPEIDTKDQRIKELENSSSYWQKNYELKCKYCGVKASLEQIETERNYQDGVVIPYLEQQLTEKENQIAEYEKALGVFSEQFEDILTEQDYQASVDLPEDLSIIQLGDRIGYGNLIHRASVAWKKMLHFNKCPSGGEFVSAGCRATIEDLLDQAKEVLERFNKEK